MNIEQLRELAEQNSVPVGNSQNSKRIPPYYYDSLRNGFSFYFKTFNTQNASYDFYAQGLANRDVSILAGQLLDDENTILTIVSFQRFFELFLKEFLSRAHPALVMKIPGNVESILQRIQNGTVEISEKTVAFNELIVRLFSMIDQTKDSAALSNHDVVRNFADILRAYHFLETDNYRASLEYLNWWRNEIMHNGNKLPSLWLLDYSVTQRWLPIISNILEVEKPLLGKSLFYLETESKINILEKLIDVKYEFEDLKNPLKVQETFSNLLYIGHLKELGRASLNMNIFVRKNVQATYEYNYKDPKGRGIRFAEAERIHENFRDIKKCPCCSEPALVIYRVPMDDLWNNGNIINIDWVKCYTCEYHIRYNVSDPKLFNLAAENYFTQI